MSDPLRTLVVDTSVLVNFLQIDRLDLLAALPNTRVVVTDHVRTEITEDHSEQIERFDAAVERGLLTTLRVDGLEELRTFVDLEPSGLGIGERSAFAAAFHRGFSCAIDDRRAIRIAARTLARVTVVRTEDIVRRLIDAGGLSVAEADALKHDWETRYRFALPFDTFGDPP